MAASGPMADFARLPNDRKVLVFVVIGAVLGLLYYQFVYKSLSEDLQTARGENTAKANLNAKLAKDIPDYEKLKADMQKLEERIARNQESLPTEAELPAFFEMLERKVRQSGVEVNKLTKLNEAPFETFVKVPVDIELTGSFMQIKRFFASLVQKGVSPAAAQGGDDEDRERVVSIENLQLVNPTVRNREIVLTARFTAVTYRQDEPKGPAAPPPGVVQQSAAAKPPMPSAATPAGAKARTEDAMKKDQERTDAKAPAGAGDGSARLKGGL